LGLALITLTNEPTNLDNNFGNIVLTNDIEGAFDDPTTCKGFVYESFISIDKPIGAVCKQKPRLKNSK
jgi:hypothetical protein